MRPSRRFLLSLHAILIFLLLAASHSARAQAPAQASQPGQLSPAWNDAVRALAEKIAAAAGASHEISLDVKNISSLNAFDVAAIRQELQDELKRRGLVITRAQQSEAQVQLTLSDSAGAHVLAAEIHHGNEHQINIFSITGEPAVIDGRPREALTLAAKLVWVQQGKFLDFALFDGVPELKSNLLVLEPGRLAYYQSRNLHWEFSRTIPISHSRPVPRDIQGRIDFDHNKVVLTDAECTGRLTSANDVQCNSLVGLQTWVSFANIPGREGALVTSLPAKCNEGAILLASGTSDWTQPDSIQGYENVQGGMPAAPAGNAINFEGPILSLQPTGEGAVARVVVHNRRTGKYEAYLVTATCSH
jgi:hypothetical protein